MTAPLQPELYRSHKPSSVRDEKRGPHVQQPTPRSDATRQRATQRVKRAGNFAHRPGEDGNATRNATNTQVSNNEAKTQSSKLGVSTDHVIERNSLSRTTSDANCADCAEEQTETTADSRVSRGSQTSRGSEWLAFAMA
jgi:hypothetical protein